MQWSTICWKGKTAMLSLVNLRMDQGVEWFEERPAGVPRALLVLVSYGKCVYWIEHEKVIAEKGDLLLIPPNTAYYGKSIPTVVHEKYVAVVEVESAGPGRSEASAAGALPLLHIKRWVKAKTGLYDYMLERIRRCFSEWTDQEAYAAVRGQAIVLELFALWNRELDGAPASSDLTRLAERMKAYIQEHYRSKITKEELGACIGRSPNYAATVFRRITGQTISEYVHAVRMKSAVFLLRDSLLTVAEISEMLGYRDVSYFQRTFKRIYASTPSAYMKER